MSYTLSGFESVMVICCYITVTYYGDLLVKMESNAHITTVRWDRRDTTGFIDKFTVIMTWNVYYVSGIFGGGEFWGFWKLCQLPTILQ